MTRWLCNEAEIEDLIKRGRIKSPKVPAPAKESKYHSNKTEVDGIKFDSRKEADYYRQLKLRKQAGDIVGFELQPAYELQPGYVRDGKKIRPIVYVADFKVTNTDGTETVVDVKSYITEKNPVYRLKRKMLLYKYPEVDFREIM